MRGFFTADGFVRVFLLLMGWGFETGEMRGMGIRDCECYIGKFDRERGPGWESPISCDLPTYSSPCMSFPYRAPKGEGRDRSDCAIRGFASFALHVFESNIGDGGR